MRRKPSVILVERAAHHALRDIGKAPGDGIGIHELGAGDAMAVVHGHCLLQLPCHRGVIRNKQIALVLQGDVVAGDSYGLGEVLVHADRRQHEVGHRLLGHLGTEAFDGEWRRQRRKAIAHLDQHRVEAGLRQPEGGGHADDAATNHHDVSRPGHARGIGHENLAKRAHAPKVPPIAPGLAVRSWADISVCSGVRRLAGGSFLGSGRSGRRVTGSVSAAWFMA